MGHYDSSYEFDRNRLDNKIKQQRKYDPFRGMSKLEIIELRLSKLEKQLKKLLDNPTSSVL